ncbi:MAG: DEAD/DEAH box helicase family protein [Moraxellaceae bacterium]|nr:DEAD/DEAH box helicase family protein [Moraxellaceae bacterium]
MAQAPKKSASKKNAKTLNFHQQLVTNQWLLNFFNPNDLTGLKNRLEHPKFEGIDEDGQTKFFHELCRSLFHKHLIDENSLRRYDLNIVKHWQQITERRNYHEGVTLHLKYFQYLSLLVAEIYLDYYVNKPQEMLVGLNEQLTQYNADKHIDQQFERYSQDDLNKVAYWSATGSGKTLLLHVNILQYLHYFKQKNGDKAHPDKIILLTPNEGLSHQHFKELQESGFEATFFDKNKIGQGSLDREVIQIIDINKLADEMGDKTVAVEAFTGNNLVLVDEGHRGAGTAAGAWMSRRETLSKGGFSFEYSATFGQAIGKSDNVYKATLEAQKKKAKMLGTEKADIIKLELDDLEKQKVKQQALREVYAKSILFDYSYKYFYQDGYGKESLILNLQEAQYSNKRDLYFTACLLAFYQQLYLFKENNQKLSDYNLEKPLWVFVGNKVNDDDSDILTVILFLAQFLENKQGQIITWLDSLLKSQAELLNDKGHNIFYDRFTPLMGKSAQDVYSDILKTVFNSNSSQRLNVVNVKGVKGELRLQVGEAQPFGLINVGDETGLFGQCETHSTQAFLNTQTDSFGQSIFGTINHKDSHLNILIGSRKFTEGWSSWRVSTMGLLNMGKGEGSQIIQLFGRGVRLKGQDYSLKRSTRAELNQPQLRNLHLDKLQTINIFGVNANYMETFKAYLKEEGVTPQDEILQLDFKTKTNKPSHSLKTLTLKDGYKDNQPNGFKRKVFPELYEIPKQFIDTQTGDSKLKKIHIELDLYPRLQAIDTTGKLDGLSIQDQRQQIKIPLINIHLFDFDRIYLAIQSYKQQRAYSNLRLDYQKLWEFCLAKPDWYTLYAPEHMIKNSSLSALKQQEDILIQLLKDYTERFFKSIKNAYEGQFYTVTTVKADDDSLCKIYHIEFDVENGGQTYYDRLNELQTLIDKGKVKEAVNWQAGQLTAILFDRHLYYPLFDVQDKNLPLKMTPLSFDAPSEINFVKDLQAFYQSPEGKRILEGYSLYLLRNADNKAKGLGFTTAGNFYPDFLLWLVNETTGQQHLSLIDPKGIRQLNLTDPKLQLYREIKEIEKQVNDSKLNLTAFILSNTALSDLLNNTQSQQELEDKHVLFMEDGGYKYLPKLFNKIMA